MPAVRTTTRPAPSTGVRISRRVLHSLIGLAAMPVIAVLPAPGALTPTGMAVIGVFAGTLYLWTFVDLVWPSLLGIALSAFFVNAVLHPAAEHGIWTALQQSIGNWVVAFVIGSLLLTTALNDTGLTTRVADWLLSRPFARRSPWAFTYALFACSFLLGMFLDLVPTVVLMMAIASAIFRKLGYSYGEKYPLVVMIGCTFLINIAFASTPISHPVTLLGFGVFADASHGLEIGFVEYMFIGVPVGGVAAIAIALFLRYAVRPDMSRFDNVDYRALMSQRAEPLSRREIAAGTIFGLVALTWILPGIISLFAPNAGIVTFFDDLTLIVPTLFGVVLMMLLRVGGKPIIDHGSAFRSLPWGILFLVACAMLYGTLLTQDAVGLNHSTVNLLTPVFAAGVSPFLVVLVLVLGIAALTNVANNVPVVILFVAVCVPLSSALGADGRLVGTLVILAAQMGFALPSALASIALIFGDPWVSRKAVVRHGIAATLISALAIALVGYPLGLAVF